MGNGTIGKGPPVGGASQPAEVHAPEEPGKSNSTQKTETTNPPTAENQSPGTTGRSPAALKNDPAAALTKATLAKASGLKKPSKAQVEEIRTAIKDGKKEEAIKLTIKYYNIDTSGAAEVKYNPPKETSSTPAHSGQNPYHEVGTATRKVGGKIEIVVGDESFRFKKPGETGEGTPSPEWLAAAIYHESYHAKNHFNPNEPQVYRPATSSNPNQMTQEELGQEIEAYAKEQTQRNVIGLNEDMLTEIQSRQNKLYAELTPENRDIARQMLQGRQPWPHQ